jgi:hypothetical protein
VRHAGLTTTVAQSTPLDATPLNAAERQELIDLHRKFKQVQMARDILAKAMA